MRRSLLARAIQLASFLLFPLGVLFFTATVRGQSPSDPNVAPRSDSAQLPATPPAPASSTSAASSESEVSSQDTAATFKVRVNLVLVRVVVRDAAGNVVADL